MLKVVLFLLCAPIVRSLLSCAELIPYLGIFFQALNPVIAFFIFLSIGWYVGEVAEELTQIRRTLFFAYALVVCSLTYIAPYVVGYYTFPVKIARTVSAQKHVKLTYQQASNSVKALLREKTGSDGVTAYAIYSARSQLSAHSVANYAAKQLEEAEDIVVALLNIILHVVPFLLKWMLCDKLAWIREPGLVGLTFWYLFSVTLLYVGYRKY